MSTLPWLFDEFAVAGEEHLTPALVAAYDVKSRFDPSSEIAHLAELGLSSESTLVDLGAGTGSLAIEVGKRCRRVVAADVSRAMLGALESKAAAANLANIETVNKGFLTYEHVGPKADIVYTRNALHHLPDFWKAVALVRIARMLKPGGILRLRDIVYSFIPGEAKTYVEGWLERASADPFGIPRRELEAHVRGEYSTYSWILEGMLERAGFEIREAEYNPNRLFAKYVCIRQDTGN